MGLYIKQNTTQIGPLKETNLGWLSRGCNECVGFDYNETLSLVVQSHYSLSYYFLQMGR